MDKITLIILDLLHDMKIDVDSILQDNFAEAFNLKQEYSLENRKSAIDFLIQENLVELKTQSFLELTIYGGQTWECLFKVNWDLYFEFFRLYENGINDPVYFYATNLANLKHAISLSSGLMKENMIKKANNWQPIYWKEVFQGYMIETKNYDLLPNFYELLPAYRDLSILKNLLQN